VTVIEVNESTVVMDANHELAGKALTFEIKLLEIVK
jgi:FKBP-type peptidyl-prolyl cis-trans isomerase 2